jgi:hypothetical protein
MFYSHGSLVLLQVRLIIDKKPYTSLDSFAFSAIFANYSSDRNSLSGFFSGSSVPSELAMTLPILARSSMWSVIDEMSSFS